MVVLHDLPTTKINLKKKVSVVIMAKLTKKELIENLESKKNLVDQDGLDIVNYTLTQYKENPRNVTVADIKDSISMLNDHLLDTKDTSSKEEPKVTKKEVVKETKLKVIKKADSTKKADDTNKKEEPKKDTKVSAKKEEPKKDLFPKELVTEIGKLKRRDDIKTMVDLANEVEADKPLVICTLWTKQMLKEFDYDPFNVINGKLPKEFPNDLDILQIYYSSENVTYGASAYTEVHSTFTPSGFENDAETMSRCCEGLEYQIYEIIE